MLYINFDFKNILNRLSKVNDNESYILDLDQRFFYKKKIKKKMNGEKVCFSIQSKGLTIVS